MDPSHRPSLQQQQMKKLIKAKRLCFKLLVALNILNLRCFEIIFCHVNFWWCWCQFLFLWFEMSAIKKRKTWRVHFYWQYHINLLYMPRLQQIQTLQLCSTACCYKRHFPFPWFCFEYNSENYPCCIWCWSFSYNKDVFLQSRIFPLWGCSLFLSALVSPPSLTVPVCSSVADSVSSIHLCALCIFSPSNLFILAPPLSGNELKLLAHSFFLLRY